MFFRIECCIGVLYYAFLFVRELLIVTFFQCLVMTSSPTPEQIDYVWLITFSDLLFKSACCLHTKFIKSSQHIIWTNISQCFSLSLAKKKRNFFPFKCSLIHMIFRISYYVRMWWLDQNYSLVMLALNNQKQPHFQCQLLNL